MLTKTEQVLFEIFNEFMIAIGNYERLDDRQLVKFLESASATFTTLDRDVLDRYKAYLKTEIEHENARGAFERASSLEDLADLVD
jgi:hypothetical protein